MSQFRKGILKAHATEDGVDFVNESVAIGTPYIIHTSTIEDMTWFNDAVGVVNRKTAWVEGNGSGGFMPLELLEVEGEPL